MELTPLLVGLIAFGVLAFGGVYPWAYWPIAIVSVWTGAWMIVVKQAWRDWRVWRLAWALAAVAAAMVLQVVSIPPFLLDLLSPDARQVLAQYEVGYALRAGDWRPLSLLPSGTVLALVLFLAFAVLLVGLIRGVRYIDLDRLILPLTGLALVVAVIGILQKAGSRPGETLIYGFWEPQFRGDAFGPFVNRNHYAGWMIMVMPLVLAYALSILEPLAAARGGVRRWLSSPEMSRAAFYILTVLVLGTTLLLTGSRSGMGALAVVLAVMGTVAFRRLPTRSARVTALIVVPVLLIGTLAWAGLGPILARFGQVPVEIQDRVLVWQDSLRMIADFPVAGVGMGAFGTAMAVYQTAPRHTLFVQAHNDYLQIAAEGGLLVVVPVLVVLIFVVQGIWRRFRQNHDEPTRYWLRAGALAGLCGIAAQSLFEFSLQKPGNTVLFVLLLALALHRPSERLAKHAHRL